MGPDPVTHRQPGRSILKLELQKFDQDCQKKPQWWSIYNYNMHWSSSLFWYYIYCLE